MATTGTGFDVPIQLNLERRERQQQRTEEDHAQKIQDLLTQRSSIVSKIGDYEKGSPEYQQSMDALQKVNLGIVDAYHPDKNPGAIQKLGHLLTDHLGITSPQKRADATAAKQQTKTANAKSQSEMEVAAAPPSPTEQAKAKAAADLATIQGAVKNYATLNPNATDADKQSFFSDLLQKTYGTTLRGNWTNVAGKMNGQPTTLLFDKATRQYRLQNGEAVPPEMLATFVPETKTTEADKVRQDFEVYKEKYKKEHNGQEYPGTIESWKAEQSGLGHQAALAAKPPNRDDRYIAIQAKELQHQPLTPDEQAYQGAYDLWVKKTKIDPGVARMAALADDRYTWVYDLNDPDKNLKPMRMKDAANAPVGTPQSIAFKTDAAITRYMTSGQGATNINYFNTATDHLKILQEAGDALNNGDYPAFNRLANQFKTATGDPAPTNFDSVKSAVAGELSKTFKGTGATDQEISEINATINKAYSPEEIMGAIDYYSRLMGSKMRAIKEQYESGKQGKPAFQDSGSASAPTQQYIYAKDKQGKVHRAKLGTNLPEGWTLTSAPATK